MIGPLLDPRLLAGGRSRSWLAARGGGASGEALTQDPIFAPPGVVIDPVDPGRGTKTGGNNGRPDFIPGGKAIPRSRKGYFEVEIGAEGSHGTVSAVGVVTREQRHDYDTQEFSQDEGVAWKQDGSIWYDGAEIAGAGTAPSWGEGDTLQFGFDPDTAKLWIGKNDTWQGDPVAGTGEAATGSVARTYYPAIQYADVGDSRTLRGNKGKTRHGPPEGFVEIGEEVEVTLGEASLVEQTVYAVVGRKADTISLVEQAVYAVLKP